MNEVKESDRADPLNLGAFRRKPEDKKPVYRPDVIMGVLSSDFEPVGPYVLVERAVVDEQTIGTSGKIIAPDTTREPPRWGFVVAVGDGWRDPESGEVLNRVAYRVGDTVVFSRHAGEDIPFQDGVFLCLRADEVRGRVRRARQESKEAPQDGGS